MSEIRIATDEIKEIVSRMATGLGVDPLALWARVRETADEEIRRSIHPSHGGRDPETVKRLVGVRNFRQAHDRPSPHVSNGK